MGPFLGATLLTLASIHWTFQLGGPVGVGVLAVISVVGWAWLRPSTPDVAQESAKRDQPGRSEEKWAVARSGR